MPARRSGQRYGTVQAHRADQMRHRNLARTNQTPDHPATPQFWKLPSMAWNLPNVKPECA
jgi:hypothetical protein